MRAPFLMWLGLGGLACTHTQQAAKPAAVAEAGEAAQASPDRIQEVIRGALPAVVLLVQERPDGQLTYGSGFIFSDDGLVLTNLHVVDGQKPVRAMLYREDRVSYTPMDGGLGRYLFENARDLVPARVIRRAPAMDLAVVRVDADLSKLPKLKLATAPIGVGERVYALGHPQETVWSFTSGAVSAIHHGAIQHDAVVSHGSSGGPLLNARGQVVGINTSRVVSEARGMAFARPVEMAREWALERKESGPEIDFASLTDAVSGCWRAEEVGAQSLADCFDMDHSWDINLRANDALKAELGVAGDEAAAWDRVALPPGGKADFVAMFRRNFVTYARGEMWTPTPPPPGHPELTPPARRARLEELAARCQLLSRDRKVQLQKQNNLKASPADADAFRETLHMGIRVDEVHKVSDALAWVRFTGRNRDGSEFAFSEAWGQRDGRWHQRSPPAPEDLKLLPVGFPTPLDSFAWEVERKRVIVSRRMLGKPSCDDELMANPTQEDHMSGVVSLGLAAPDPS